MELGKKQLRGIILIGILILPVQLLAADVQWTVGLVPMDTSALVDDEDLLIAESFEGTIKEFFHRAESRWLSAEDAAYLSRREDRKQLQRYYREVHRQVVRDNERFFASGSVERSYPAPPELYSVVIDSVKLKVKTVDAAFGYDQKTAAYLISVDHALDELIASSLVGEDGSYSLHIYHYHRGAHEIQTLHYKTYSAGEPIRYDVLAEELKQFIPAERTKLTAEEPAPKEHLHIRSIPSDVRVIGDGGMKQVSRDGYTSQYIISDKKEGIIDVVLEPAWKGSVYSLEQRTDRFYRSLAAALLSFPVTFLTSGLADDSDLAGLAYRGAVGMNITLTVRTIIDLFRYTLYEL